MKLSSLYGRDLAPFHRRRAGLGAHSDRGRQQYDNGGPSSEDSKWHRTFLFQRRARGPGAGVRKYSGQAHRLAPVKPRSRPTYPVAHTCLPLANLGLCSFWAPHRPMSGWVGFSCLPPTGVMWYNCYTIDALPFRPAQEPASAAESAARHRFGKRHTQIFSASLLSPPSAPTSRNNTAPSVGSEAGYLR